MIRSPRQFDTLVRQTFADQIIKLGEKYIKDYGCANCWGDTHGCSCESDKRVLQTFIYHLSYDIKNGKSSA
jgi:hypothetical protein